MNDPSRLLSKFLRFDACFSALITCGVVSRERLPRFLAGQLRSNSTTKAFDGRPSPSVTKPSAQKAPGGENAGGYTLTKPTVFLISVKSRERLAHAFAGCDEKRQKSLDVASVVPRFANPPSRRRGATVFSFCRVFSFRRRVSPERPYGSTKI